MSQADNPTGPPSTSVTSISLLDRAKAHDPDAWEKLVSLYGPLVYAWCRRWGIQPDDVMDVAQEVFQAVAGAIEGFQKDGPGTSFRGWLWTITRHEACDHFSRVAKSPQAIGGTDIQLRLAQIPERSDNDSDYPEAITDSAGLVRQALNVIRGDFQEQTWLAFLHTAVDGRAAPEVAAELGMTKRAVRQAKYRVLQRLRDEFGNLIE